MKQETKLIELTSEELCLYIEPWEVVAKGDLKCAPGNYRVMVIQNGIINKETRIWYNSGPKFINPVFEELNVDSNVQSPLTIYSSGRPNYHGFLDTINKWKEDKPVASVPWYYQACVLLSLGKHEEFLKVSEHYMHVGDKKSMSAIMNRYYYSLVQLLYCKKVRPTLQNLSICLANKPLMAEFWCLMGDVHYHLRGDYDKAKCFYENAIFLGKKRPLDDEWPIDIAKYSKYPTKMIESCKSLIKESFYLSSLPSD